MARVKFNSAGAIRIVRRSATEGAIEVMKQVLEESQQEVPVRTGQLRDSGRLNVFGTRVTITYNMPYAAIQHENLNYKHTVGKAKYLEDPYNRIVPGARKTISQKIAEALPWRRN